MFWSKYKVLYLVTLNQIHGIPKNKTVADFIHLIKIKAVIKLSYTGLIWSDAE